MKGILFTDGGARGNPGPAATGVVLKGSEGNTIKTSGTYLGKATNNSAEYSALIEGLNLAVAEKLSEIKCLLDSELVVKQLNGLYKVKDQNIKKLFSTVKELEKKFQKITYEHIVRSKNTEADAIVNQVLDEQLYQ